MKERTKVKSCRLTEYYARLLKREATKQKMGESEFLRKIVQEALSDDRLQQLFEEIRAVQKSLGNLHQNQETQTIALLADAGRAEAGEAVEFVRKNFVR